MADIHETLINYVDACRAASAEVHPFVQTVLDNEKSEALFGDGGTGDCYLKLCGNNHLLTDVRLNDDDVTRLCKTLEANTFVTALDLRYNRITDIGAVAVANLLEKNNALTELNLMCNDIGPEGAAAIAKAIQGNDTLKSLNMTGNKIDNAGGMHFAQALQVNTALVELDLGECDLRIDCVIALATVLNFNTTLKILNVSRPLLWTQQEETTVHCANLLVRSRTLTELHLGKYEMRDFGAARLADSLIDNFFLTVLDLSYNRITRDGAKLLANVLKNNTNLEVLDLAGNRLECDGAAHLAEAISTYNTNLKILVVTFNQIRGRGICALADALKFNSTLDQLLIWGNDLEEVACVAMNVLLQSGRLNPRTMDVRPYTVDGRVYLAQVSIDVDYRAYRYTAPVHGDGVPDKRKYKLS